jgi:hypothetical protein
MDQQKPYDSTGSQQSGSESSRQQQSQYNQRHPYEGEKLPGDPLAITLGIVSLVFFFIFCWCYGVISIITLVISIVGLVVANKNIAQYHADPGRYSYSTFKSVQNARVINIIGTIVSGLVTFILLILLLFFGSIFYALIDGNWDDLRNLDNQELYEDDYYEEPMESTTDEWQYYENETDSVQQETDSTTYQVQEIETPEEE